jgi:hypothetical protein
LFLLVYQILQLLDIATACGHLDSEGRDGRYVCSSSSRLVVLL